MTTALYLLRCLQIGLRLSDLDALDMGQVLDIITESGNDHEKYQQLATQEDFDKF
jgi:hypothetical protein